MITNIIILPIMLHIIIIYDCTEDVRVGVISKHNNIKIVEVPEE